MWRERFNCILFCIGMSPASVPVECRALYSLICYAGHTQQDQLKARCGGVKTIRKVTGSMVLCGINQPPPQGEILLFLGNSCIKHISKGIRKTY